MPDGNQIVANAADGTQHIFPSGTDPAVIDKAMKIYVASKPGTYMTRKGGPLLNTKDLPAPDPESDNTKRMRGAGLGLAEGLGVQPAATGWDTIKNTISNFGSSVKNQAVDSFHHSQQFLGEKGYDSPLSLAATPIDMLAHIIENSATNLQNTGKSGVQAVQSGDLEGLYHALGSGAGQLATLRAGREVPEMAKDPIGVQRMGTTGREILNEGPSKTRVLTDQDAHAQAVKSHISTVAEAVHDDAQQAMSKALAGVDATNPNGAFEKVDRQTAITEALKDIPEDQIPKSIKRILKEEKGESWDSVLQNNTQRYIAQLKDQGLNTAQINKVLAKEGMAEPDWLKQSEGETQPGYWTAEQYKQLRSGLGKELPGLQGSVKAAASKVYALMSTDLRREATKADIANGIPAEQAGQGWLDANARWKNYIDDFVRSPVKMTLKNNTASGIMEPLYGGSRTQVLNILSKYEPFGLDMDKVNQEVSRYGVGKTVLGASKPGKLDLIIAGLSPKAAALRMAGPRIMRNPDVIGAIGGKGFDAPTIKPGKVYPSKEAAAAALKGEQ
jgi:hypothetical protein